MKYNTKVAIVAIGAIVGSIIIYGSMIAGIVWVIVSVLRAMGVIQ
jgi:hypothetical protein